MSQWMEELMAKKQHPERLHEELWFNEDGEVRIEICYSCEFSNPDRIGNFLAFNCFVYFIDE